MLSFLPRPSGTRAACAQHRTVCVCLGGGGHPVKPLNAGNSRPSKEEARHRWMTARACSRPWAGRPKSKASMHSEGGGARAQQSMLWDAQLQATTSVLRPSDALWEGIVRFYAAALYLDMPGYTLSLSMLLCGLEQSGADAATFLGRTTLASPYDNTMIIVKRGVHASAFKGIVPLVPRGRGGGVDTFISEILEDNLTPICP